MALDMRNLVREVLSNALQGMTPDSLNGNSGGKSNGGHTGMKGLAAGAGAAALAPLAVKNAGKLARALGVDSLEDIVKSPGEALEGAKSNLGERLSSNVKDQAKGALDQAGGPGGLVKETAKQMLPGGGGGGTKGGAPGVGKGRRMPVQQSVDIGLPIETVYNQWTQFEDWPNFMHRVTRASQEDDCTVSFAVKIWGKTKEFTAKIKTQRPEQRIKWQVTQGMTHTGIVTFHELGPNLTRVLLGFDVDPGGLVEKFARGARHVKRAARGDLHRFKAFIEMAEQETGAWRGVIENGEIVEEHDPSYDEQRDYSDIEDFTESEDDDEEQDSEDQDEDEETEGRSDDDQDEDDENDEEASPPRKRRRSQTRQRTGASKQGGSNGGDPQSQSGRRRRQSSSSGGGRSASGSSRSQGGRTRSSGSSSGTRSRSTASRPRGRSRSSSGSSNSQPGARSRSRSQNRKS
jgi:uncharacterized membrane protein